MDAVQEFEALRPRLFGLAYRMLGTRADAEDVVQEAYLRWIAADGVDAPKPYLMRVVANLSLDALKSAQRRRETYVGPWLPEPLIEPSATQPVELAESLSMAFLHVLERLSPAERIAFLMREVFEADYAEVAGALETNEANARQIVSRAKKQIDVQRPRFVVDRARQQQILESFLVACKSGDAAQLKEMLAEDAFACSDGGGKAAAAIRPVLGADRVARFFAGLGNKFAEVYRRARIEFVQINGMPGALLYAGDHLQTAVTLDVNAGGLIRGVFLVRNPEKLRGLAS